MINQPVIISTISPLHIGDGLKITSVGEYVCTNNTIRIIDQEHLLALLKSKGIYNDYITFILNYAEQTHIWDFFVKNGIEKDIRYTREIKLNAETFNPESNNILESAINTGGKKYIPGSSLKGAIRNLVFADLIARDSELKEDIEQIILQEEKLHFISNKIEATEDEWLQQDFHHFRVEDSVPIDDDFVSIEVSKRVHLFGVKTEGLDNLRECINKDAKLNSLINISDERLNDYFGNLKTNGITELFQVINRITELFIDFEINLLKASGESISKEILHQLKNLKILINNAKGEYAILRLGKGKTYLYQVILPVLSEAAQKKVLELLFHDEEKRRNFPHTRVLNDSNEMFGWVKLSLPGFTIDEDSSFNNHIEPIIKDETKLIAYFLEEKEVCFKYKGIFYPSIQLVNKFKKVFPKGKEIEVTVHQVTNQGKINQVIIE